MTKTRQSSQRRNAIDVALATECFIAAVESMSGVKRTTMAARATGLTEQALRRSFELPVRNKVRLRVLDHVRRYQTGVLARAGFDTDDIDAILAAKPEADGFGSLIYWILLPSPGECLDTMELASHFDAVEKSFDALTCAHQDPEVAWHRALRPSMLDPAYFAPVAAAGMPAWPEPSETGHKPALVRWAHVSTHIVLSLLAALDHEVSARVFGTGNGRALFALLIADPASGAGRRSGANAPIARLVDFIAALGIRIEKNAWPPRRPGPKIIAARWGEAAGDADGDVERRVGNLRNSHTRMTMPEFTRYARSQLSMLPNDDRSAMVQFLAPMLLAAHTLPLLMPAYVKTTSIAGVSRRTGRYDTSGWRDAYLLWWRFHAESRGLPLAPEAGRETPDWLVGDQSSSSCLSQSSGRSS